MSPKETLVARTPGATNRTVREVKKDSAHAVAKAEAKAANAALKKENAALKKENAKLKRGS